MDKNISGEELVALSAAVSLALARCMDNAELSVFCELLGLVKHDIEVIKSRRHHGEKK